MDQGSKIIKKNIRRNHSSTDFESLGISEDSHIHFDIMSAVEDTHISKLYLNKNCVKAILEWVNISLRTNPVPEVGGFFFGVHKNSDFPKKWEIAVEIFYPSKQVEFQDSSSIRFGETGMQELSKHIEANKSLAILGWFHTHPGHTPYLSATDLNRIHNGFFRAPYQVAMVLDPLTKKFDTGIFTRKVNGQMNNKPDLRFYWSFKK